MLQFQLCRLAALVLSCVGFVGAVDRDSTPASRVPILTVCEALRDPGQYAGKIVIIVGRSAGSDEASWIDEDCGLKLVIQGRTYRSLISTAYAADEFAPPPKKFNGFKWDKGALQRALDRVKSTTRLDYKAYWCAIYGRLETAPTREIRLNDGTVGYGHMGGAPAQLIAATDGFLRLKGR
jgi:hypothetical protein